MEGVRMGRTHLWKGFLLCNVRKGGEGHGTAVKGAFLEGRRYRVEGAIHYMRESRIIIQ